MENQSKTHWTRFFTFIGILFCIVLLLNYTPKLIRTNAIKYWRYFYSELPENSMDIVFLGNSHTQCTFIPEIIDDLLGVRSIDLITSSETIHQTKYEYQEVLRYQNPMAVVIETGVIYGGRDQSVIRPWQFSFFDSMPFSLRKMRYLHEFFSTPNLIKYYFPIIAYHTDWKAPDVPINKAANLLSKKNIPVELNNKGYLQLKAPMLPEDAQKINTGIPGICPAIELSKRLTSTEDVLRIDESDPSTLLFIEAPTYLNKFISCQSQINQLLETHGVSHYQVLNDTDPRLLWFRDSTHLSQFGAIIASIETAQILSEKLDITMNPEMLEYYKSYQFQDYSLVHDGKSINISLIPANKKTSKALNFEWEVFQNGKSIHKTIIQGGNEYNFSLPDPAGSYLISVKINNPAGDYLLEGEFSLIHEVNTELANE